MKGQMSIMMCYVNWTAKHLNSSSITPRIQLWPVFHNYQGLNKKAMHTEQKYFKTEDDEGEEKQAPQFAIKLTIKN